MPSGGRVYAAVRACQGSVWVSGSDVGGGAVREAPRDSLGIEGFTLSDGVVTALGKRELVGLA